MGFSEDLIKKTMAELTTLGDYVTAEYNPWLKHFIIYPVVEKMMLFSAYLEDLVNIAHKMGLSYYIQFSEVYKRIEIILY